MGGRNFRKPRSARCKRSLLVPDPKESQASRAAARATSASAARPSRSQEVVEIREHEADEIVEERGVLLFLSSYHVGAKEDRRSMG